MFSYFFIISEPSNVHLSIFGQSSLFTKAPPGWIKYHSRNDGPSIRFDETMSQFTREWDGNGMDGWMLTITESRVSIQAMRSRINGLNEISRHQRLNQPIFPFRHSRITRRVLLCNTGFWKVGMNESDGLFWMLDRIILN
jgi:hypothetical protein